MFSYNGIGVDSWVRVDGRGHLTYELVAEQAQLRYGSERGSGLTLVLTEQALEELEAAAGQALRILRGEQESDGPAPPIAGLGDDRGSAPQ